MINLDDIMILTEKKSNFKQTIWNYIKNKYPYAIDKLYRYLKNFIDLTRNYVDNTTTDPTERFFIQQVYNIIRFIVDS